MKTATTSCTEDNDKRWRSRTCAKVLELNGIICSFKENPQVPKEVCDSFSTVSENNRMVHYRYKVVDILVEAEKQMIEFNKLGVLVQRFMDTISLMLTRLHGAMKQNQDGLELRNLRTFFEKRHKDCPEVLLEVERRKLKDYRCLLQVEMKSLGNHYRKMDLAQYRMSEFVKYVRRNTKMLERRIKSVRCQFENSLYCPDEGEKLKFGEREMSALIYNFCGKVCEMEKLAEDGRCLLDCSRARVEELWGNKTNLFDVLNTALKDKIKQLKKLMDILTKAIRDNNIYNKHMLKRLDQMNTLLTSNPHCDHVLKYVKETNCNFSKLNLNDRKLKMDKASKLNAIATDNTVLHKRAYSRKAI